MAFTVSDQLDVKKFEDGYVCKSCDLHMEHLNRLAKDAIKGLGANKSMKAIDQVGKALGTITNLISTFDTVNNVSDESGHHSKQSSEKDLHMIVN